MSFNIQSFDDIGTARKSVHKYLALLKPINHIWNEDFTRLGNRQITEEHNKQWKLRHKTNATNEQCAIEKSLECEIIAYIMRYGKVSKEIAECVWLWCVELDEANAHEYVPSVLQLIERIRSV